MKRSIFKVIAFLMLFTCVNSASLPVSAEVNHALKAYEAGMDAYQKEEYQKAIYAFQNSIKFNEKFYKSHYMLGLSLLLNDEPEAAEKSLLDTIEYFPKEWKAQALLAEFYSTQNNYDLAITYYQKVVDSKSIKKNDKDMYQEKLDTLIAERTALWRVTEDEKDKIIKNIKLPSDLKSWRAVIVERKNKDLHLSYLSKTDELEGGKWKTMLDLKCETPKLGGFSEFNQQTADQFRKQGSSELTTIEQQGETRIFETKLNQKPNLYIIGRIFKSPVGFCTAQVIQPKTKFKDEEIKDWVGKIKPITIEG